MSNFRTSVGVLTTDSLFTVLLLFNEFLPRSAMKGAHMSPVYARETPALTLESSTITAAGALVSANALATTGRFTVTGDLSETSELTPFLLKVWRALLRWDDQFVQVRQLQEEEAEHPSWSCSPRRENGCLSHWREGHQLVRF